MVVDVLTDEASIDRGVKPLLFVGDILHAIAMSDIDEIEGSGCDQILQASRRPDVGFQVRQQRVSLEIIEPHPVRHCSIDVDYHDVTPIGSRPVATRPVDPIRSRQQVRENLWWQGTLRVLTDRTPQAQKPQPAACRPRPALVEAL